MKTINGTTFEVQLVCNFEFTREDADQFLSARSENQRETLNEICSRKHPLPELGTYNAQQFRLAIGKNLADRREAELKQLTEGTHDAKQAV